MKYNIKTTLDTMSDAYLVLSELGLAGLLDGSCLQLRPNELLGSLIGQKRLQEFLSIITGATPADIGELRPSEALEIISAFFLDMSAELRSLPGIMATITPTHKAAKATKATQ